MLIMEDLLFIALLSSKVEYSINPSVKTGGDISSVQGPLQKAATNMHSWFDGLLITVKVNLNLFVPSRSPSLHSPLYTASGINLNHIRKEADLRVPLHLRHKFDAADDLSLCTYL